MTKTYIIEKFEDIIEIGTTLGFNWFRGHSRVINALTPGIYREDYTNDLYLGFNPNHESKIAADFKRKAPSIANNLPEYNEHLEWLFIMQHHGVPTRLLDWSENILIATFFACNNSYDQDGEIWTLLPWKLNESHGYWGLPILDKDKTLKYYAHEIFHNNPERLAEEYELKEIPKIPMALQPPLGHPRITAQQSCFTIHPKPIDGCTIQDTITDENYLVRYIIPKKLKREIEQKLYYLGITYQTIFPDLDGLAKTIIQQERSLGWGQPESLKFKEYEDNKVPNKSYI